MKEEQIKKDEPQPLENGYLTLIAIYFSVSSNLSNDTYFIVFDFKCSDMVQKYY